MKVLYEIEKQTVNDYINILFNCFNYFFHLNIYINHVSLSSLTKNHDFRPKYPELLEQPFIKYYEVAEVDIPQWFKSVVDSAGIKTHRRQVLEMYI